jgi:anhydro-N-acetylmuramic acid kinase
MSTGNESPALYIGLMSGTSMDGIDTALVEFGDHECRVLKTAAIDYPTDLKDQLLQSSRMPAKCTVDRIGQLDQWVGECFRDAALHLLAEAKVDASGIEAIGSHGQTLRHQPRAARPFTMQIGDANIIAAGTGIMTVSDFRRRDLAVGGEGAPLTPAFHQWLFSKTEKTRAVLNIGGIANVTMLSSPETIGFDTGPGNTLLDGWTRNNLDQPYDEEGNWARSGTVSEPLLAEMLNDPYFDLSPPKSTGFEYFNGAWVRSRVSAASREGLAAADVQATLAELSARTIAKSILHFSPDIEEVLVCGGGVHNTDLMQRLRSYLSGTQVTSTDAFGLHPDWVEAAAFAWLAKRRLEGKPGNIPQVTGADQAEVLGAIYSGRPEPF